MTFIVNYGCNAVVCVSVAAVTTCAFALKKARRQAGSVERNKLSNLKYTSQAGNEYSNSKWRRKSRNLKKKRKRLAENAKNPKP